VRLTESRTKMLSESAAISTQLPLVILWRDLRHVATLPSYGCIDMQITLFRT
jgi:hypothetical protein